MIKKISFRKLSHNELITLCLRLITAIEAIAAVNTGIIAKLLALVKELNQKFVLAVNRSLKTGHAEILKEKDTRRDDAFRAIRDMIAGLARCLNDTKRKPAQQLLEIFERNGWTLYMDGYQDESAELNQLISELGNPTNMEAIKGLNITDLFDDLKNSQKDFEDAFYNKANTLSKEEYAIISEIRPQLVSGLSGLLDRINSDARYADNADAYKDMVVTINNIITETDTIAKSRITRENGNGEQLADNKQVEETVTVNGKKE